MSRRECIHWKSCGNDLCILEDEGCILDSCPDYVDSGYRRPLPRRLDIVSALLAEKQKRFHELKTGCAGFRFGQGKEAHKEAQRWRAEINALKRELAYWGITDD